MYYKKLVLLSVGLTLSTAILAGQTEKNSVSATPAVETKTTHCPSPENIVFTEYRHRGHFWHPKAEGIGSYNSIASSSSDVVWTSDVSYFASRNKPTIKFLEARVITGKGKEDAAHATGHMVCSYKIDTFEEIMMLQPIHDTRILSTSISNLSAWQYLPHQPGGNFGEWRCTKNPNECSLQLSVEKRKHIHGGYGG